MKSSISEVYLRFYKKSLRSLYLLNFVVVGFLIFFLIYNSFDKSINNAKSFVNSNKTYITGLILAGGEDTVQDFLEIENKRNKIHFFKFVKSLNRGKENDLNSVPLQLGTEHLGTLYYGIRYSKAIPWTTIFMLILVSAIFTFFTKLSFDRASNFLEINIVLPLKNLSQSVQGSKTVLDLSALNKKPDVISEIALIQDVFVEFTEKMIDSEVIIAKTKVAQQVAHDIRSPLSALDMITSNLNGIEEEKRLIIRNSINRIRDIANTLSKDHRVKQEEKQSILHEKVLISPVIEMMVTEKRYEIIRKNNIQINFDQNRNNYGLFAKMTLSEFKRILSNLLNNSIEAIGSSQGIINIGLTSDQNRIFITISDNGCGMNESELVNAIQKRLSTKRIGSKGLGLSHAMDTIRSWGGEISLESKKNKGTSVTIALKQEIAPEWFVDVIDLKRLKNIVVIDDDVTIHQMWDAVLESHRLKKDELNIIHFSDFDSIKKYYGKNFANLENALFLVDYEFHEHNESGLVLIEFLGIQDQSILVTSHYENDLIQNKCMELGLRMIPKSMAGFVKIDI